MTLSWFHELERATEAAASERKPLLIDFALPD